MLYHLHIKTKSDNGNFFRVLVEEELKLAIDAYNKGKSTVILKGIKVNIHDPEVFKIYAIHKKYGDNPHQVRKDLEMYAQAYYDGNWHKQCLDSSDDVTFEILKGKGWGNSPEKVLEKGEAAPAEKTTLLNSFHWTGKETSKKDLFDQLIEKKFIDALTSFENFHEVFSGANLDTITPENKIRWIDLNARNPKTKINLQTLYELIFLLLDAKLISGKNIDPDPRNVDFHLYDMVWGCFCCNNGSPIIRENMRRVRGSLKVQGNTSRQKELAKIISSLK